MASTVMPLVTTNDITNPNNVMNVAALKPQLGCIMLKSTPAPSR